MYRLESSDGSSFSVERTWTKLGRSSSNDIVVKDIAVSRHHLNFYLENDSLVVEDAGSQNGFTLNGKVVKEAVGLKHNDKIGIGKRLFRVVENGREDEMPLPVDNFIVEHTPEVPLDTFRISEEVQVSSSKQPVPSSRKIFIGIIAVVVVFGILSQDKQEEEGATRAIASDLTEIEEQPLPTAGYQNDSFRHKSVNEIRSRAKFKEAKRDYNNRNYSRALLLFQEARTLNPANDLALTYENYTVQKIEQRLKDLEMDAERSVSRLQYRRAKIQSLQILTALSEEVPGLAQKITKEALNRSIAVNKSGKVRFRTITQEETLLHIPCEKTKRRKLCEKALKIITLSRQRLGEEDVIQ